MEYPSEAQTNSCAENIGTHQPEPVHHSHKGMSQKGYLALLVSLCTILLVSAVACVQAINRAPQHSTFIIMYHGHTDLLESIAYAPDGTKIASASNDGTIKVWDPSNGTTLLTFHQQTSSSEFANAAVAWSPDGTMLAAKSPGRDIQVWDIRTGKALLTFHGMASSSQSDTRDDEVFQLFWSPDSTKLAAAGPNTRLYVWELPIGKLLLNYLTSSKVLQVVWASDNVHLVSLEDWRNDKANLHTSVHVWDVQAAKQVFTYQSEKGVSTVDWLPNSDTIVTTEFDGSVHIWNAMTGRMLYSKKYPHDTWPSVRCSPDGTKIAIVSVTQDTRVTMEIWHAQTGAIVTSAYKTIYGLMNIFWSPDSSKVATQLEYRTLENEYGKVAIWDSSTGKHLFDDSVSSESATHGSAANGYISQVLWSPDSRWIAYGDETVHIFDAATHTRIYNFDDPNTSDIAALNRSKPDTWGCKYLAWSPDAAHIASVCHNDSVVRVWTAPR